jgi:hypothetical protein
MEQVLQNFYKNLQDSQIINVKTPFSLFSRSKNPSTDIMLKKIILLIFLQFKTSDQHSRFCKSSKSKVSWCNYPDFEYESGMIFIIPSSTFFVEK